jgi:hypothetical protein
MNKKTNQVKKESKMSLAGVLVFIAVGALLSPMFKREKAAKKQVK